jgi:hypothetical protein
MRPKRYGGNRRIRNDGSIKSSDIGTIISGRTARVPAKPRSGKSDWLKIGT